MRGHLSPSAVDDQLAEQVAETMQALAAPSRVRLLAELRGGARSVSELALAVGMEPSAVSHQLRLLRLLGLVTSRREGKRVLNQLHDDHVAVLLDEAVYHVEHVRLGVRAPAASGDAP